MRFWVSIVVLAMCGCGGGGGGGSPMPAPPTTTTQSIASGRLTASGTGGATWTMKFSGTIPADETATVTSQIPAAVMALESGHNVGAGFTITVAPQPVPVVLDTCGGGFSGGDAITFSLNPTVIFYDAAPSPPSRIASLSLVTPHSAVICTGGFLPPPGTQTLMPGRPYAVVLEV